METNTKLLVTILVFVAIIGGILIGMAAGGVFDSPEEKHKSCFWAETLGSDSNRTTDC